jgi:RHS repeat-associated protein
MTYSDAGRLISSTAGGVTTVYVYNAQGQRVKKSNPGITRYFFYDEAGHLVGEYDATGTLVQETVWMGDIPVATLRSNGVGGVEVFHVHTDHLNTPRAVSRAYSGAVVWRWDSDPFGTDASNEDPDGDLTTFAYDLRFPGQHFDVESGLSYNYFRDYDSAVGRYVQSDPIALGGGFNTYAYSEGSPILFADPLGLVICEGKWRKMREHIPIVMFAWQTVPTPTCKCYWMCMPCRGPVMWNPANWLSLPSTWGATVVTHGGNGGLDTGTAGLRPTPTGPSGRTPGSVSSASHGGSAACVCSKPGPEMGCTQCYPDTPLP